MMKLKNCLGLLMAAALTAAGWATVSCAAESDRMPALDGDAACTLTATLSYTEDDGSVTKLPDVSLTAYQVGDLSVTGGSAVYTLDTVYADTNVSFEGLTASASNEAAAVLASWAESNGTTGVTATTDASGVALFSDLQPGMYLIRQTGSTDATEEFEEIEPFLISVPLAVTASAGNFWQYNVQTLPKVELVRKLSQKTGTLQVTKNLVADSGELPTDLSYVFYVALFSDETYTVRVSDVKRFSFENGTSSIVEFANLTPGMKYYIAETDANGNRVLSGMLSDDYSFVADFPNGNNVEIPTTGDVVTLSFNNTVFELAGAAPSLSGQLTVTKRVRNLSGSAQKTDETFYIGIFTDNTYGTLASGLSSNPIAISMDGASQSEETVTVSFDGNGTTTYYLTEITDEGTPVSRDASFAYTAGYSDVKVSYSASQVDQSVTVTNTQNETETEPMTQVEPDTEPDTFVEPTTEPPTTETPQSETPQSESESESETNAEGKEVKTGDDTPIALYVGICLIAALILAEEFWRRRRNANR